MYSNLLQAPCNEPLTLIRIAQPLLESRLAHMGLFPGSVVTLMDEEVSLHTVRVRGPKGEVILGGGMGGKIVIHLDDGRMLPVVELEPGDRGHIETVTAGPGLVNTLDALGLKNNDEIEMIRRLPFMEYVTMVAGRERLRLPEGVAAKILGTMESTGEKEFQFANSQAGADFRVTRILGGMRAQKIVESLDIKSGMTLRLKSVDEAPSYRMSGNDRIVIASSEGLRIFLRRDQADMVIVGYGGDDREEAGEGE